MIFIYLCVCVQCQCCSPSCPQKPVRAGCQQYHSSYRHREFTCSSHVPVALNEHIHTHSQSVSQSVRDTFFLHAVLCLWSYIQNNILNRLKMPVFLSSVVLHPHFLNCHSFNIRSIDKWSQWFSVLLKLKVNKNVSVIHLY